MEKYIPFTRATKHRILRNDLKERMHIEERGCI